MKPNLRKIIDDGYNFIYSEKKTGYLVYGDGGLRLKYNPNEDEIVSTYFIPDSPRSSRVIYNGSKFKTLKSIRSKK